MKILEQLQRVWPMATEIHKLESQLWQQTRKQQLKVVLVTSPLRGEGKSTTTAYLAASLALHPDRKILAMDLDFRQPTLNSFFDLEPQVGIADVLRGTRPLDEAIIKTQLAALDVILPAKEFADPGLLLNSSDLAAAFQTLRKSYDLILMDAPALIPVPDACSLIPVSDGVILAAMAGVTTRHHLSRARELCLSLGANILGLVVGNVQEAAPEYLDPDYYNYNPKKSNSSNGGGD